MAYAENVDDKKLFKLYSDWQQLCKYDSPFRIYVSTRQKLEEAERLIVALRHSAAFTGNQS